MAHLLKLNKVITYAFTNISIPPMIPLILFASIKTGELILGKAVEVEGVGGINFDVVKAHLLQYLVGSLVLGLAVALFTGGLSYLLMRAFRKKELVSENAL